MLCHSLSGWLAFAFKRFVRWKIYTYCIHVADIQINIRTTNIGMTNVITTNIRITNVGSDNRRKRETSEVTNVGSDKRRKRQKSEATNL